MLSFRERAGDVIRRSLFYGIVFRVKNFRDYRSWMRSPKTSAPPHVVKQHLVREAARERNLRTLVETGTYLGEMVFAMRDYFDVIYSVELDAELYSRAKRRFSSLNHLQLLRGDSSVVLPEILRKLDNRALFWLDGHYSGGLTAMGNQTTPIAEELSCICRHRVRGHIVLIDDARCFNGTCGYPTLDQIKELVLGTGFAESVVVQDDIIRIVGGN